VDCGADLKDGDDDELADGAPSPSSRAGSTTSSKDRSTPTNVPDSSATTVTGTAVDTSVPLDSRARFGANLFLLSGIELAHVIMKLEQECPHVLEHISDEIVVQDNAAPGVEPLVAPQLEINVDAIENPLFTELSKFVQERVGPKGFHEVEEAMPRPKKKKKT
jgi:hypothetical protein